MPSDKAKEKKQQRKDLRAAGLPPGVKLPPGVTVEQFQQAMAQRQQQQMQQQQQQARQQAMRQQQLAAQVKAQQAATKRKLEIEAKIAAGADPDAPENQIQQVQHQGQPQQPVRRQRPPPPPWFKGDDRHLSITLYPIYINKHKTVAGGRRVPQDIAVPRPHIQEMFVVLQHAQFKVIMVHKMHPRDTFKGDVCNVGRLHILFKNEDGTPIKPDIAKNKNELLRYICKMVPKLKSRAQNQGQNPQIEELEQASQQPDSSSPQTGQPQNSQQSPATQKKKKRTGRGKR
jgi:signal recognition particle subunit SEC65